MFNKEPNGLISNNRSQSMTSLATNNNTQRLKRTNRSKSTLALTSPNRNIIETHMRNGKLPSSGSESNDDDTITKTSDETSESEENQSDASGQTKQSSENRSSCCTDDDSVQIRPLKEEDVSPRKSAPHPEPRKRTIPTPQVRFSKVVSHIK